MLSARYATVCVLCHSLNDICITNTTLILGKYPLSIANDISFQQVSIKLNTDVAQDKDGSAMSAILENDQGKLKAFSLNCKKDDI